MKPKEEIVLELEDIMQEVKLDKDGRATNDEKVVEENIIYVLKREKLWKSSYSICFPAGATAYLDVGNTEDDPSTYEYGFEIFSDMNTVVASGFVHGNLMVFREQIKNEDGEDEETEDGDVTGIEVVDMTLEVEDCMPRFLKREGDKEVVQFT